VGCGGYPNIFPKSALMLNMAYIMYKI